MIWHPWEKKLIKLTSQETCKILLKEIKKGINK